MEYKPYDDVMLFMGVLSVKGFPQTLRESLEKNFGPIKTISDPFPFSFTDYYVPEMGEGIERFFISFSNLVSPDSLADIKVITNEIEKEYEEDGADYTTILGAANSTPMEKPKQQENYNTT